MTLFSELIIEYDEKQSRGNFEISCDSRLFPKVRNHETLAMIMVNLAKSWLTMVPLSSSWQIMIHGLLVKVKIMANHDTWNACQDHGKIMVRSCKITMVRHVSCF